MMQEAGQAAYNLEASLQAANREFANVGGQQQWNQAIERLSQQMQVYSRTELQGAVSRTVDMTKRLGLSADQMERLIALTGDLSAGKTSLEGGIERVTAALRGEAEASEYLGLTLNETYVKGWYEAHGAMQGAWKDLSDMEKAQVRYNVFLEQAIPMQGRAAASTKTFAGALAYARKEINDAVTKNSDVASAMGELAKAIKENAAGIGHIVSVIITWAARATELVVTHRELVGQLVKITAGLYGFVKITQVFGVLRNIVLGLSAAFTVFTGQGFIVWAGSVVRAINAVKFSALGVKAALGAAAGVLLAWDVGQWAGEWLNQFDVVKRAGIAMTAGIHKGLLRVKEAWAWITGGDVEAVKREIEQVDATYAEMFAEVGQKARESGEAIKKAHQDGAAAARGAADTTKQVTGEALEAMKKQYQAYASEVKRLQDDINGRSRSLAAELREMGRTGMDSYSAWKDRKKEAEEYAAAAKRAATEAAAAMEAGDEVTGKEKFAEALQYADDAKQAYKDLSTEVKQGDQVVVSQADALKTAMDGVRRSGELGIDIIKQQQAAAKKVMSELTKKGGLADLTDGMDAAEKTWLENWQKMQSAAEKNVDAVEQRIVKMVKKDRTVYINVVERQKRALGGLIGAARLARGGKLPGFGGGDRIPTLLEAGEYVIRKEAVSRFGAGLFDALNRLRLPDLSALLPIPAPVVAAGGGRSVNINLSLGGDSFPMQTDEHTAKKLERWYSLRSSNRVSRAAFRG